MRRMTNAVEIKEPPIKEFEKKGSCLKRTCTVGCGSVILFLFIIVAAVLYAGKPRTKELRALPEHFPPSVPLYDEASVERISLLAGRERGRLLERVALIPKTFLAPLLLWLKQAETDDRSFGERFSRLMNEPVTDQRDVIELFWTDLPAEADFIQKYYQTALKREGFSLMTAAEETRWRQFTFTKDAINGRISIKDTPESPGTDAVTLTIFIPPTDNENLWRSND